MATVLSTCRIASTAAGRPPPCRRGPSSGRRSTPPPPSPERSRAEGCARSGHRSPRFRIRSPIPAPPPCQPATATRNRHPTRRSYSPPYLAPAIPGGGGIAQVEPTPTWTEQGGRTRRRTSRSGGRAPAGRGRRRRRGRGCSDQAAEPLLEPEYRLRHGVVGERVVEQFRAGGEDRIGRHGEGQLGDHEQAERGADDIDPSQKVEVPRTTTFGCGGAARRAAGRCRPVPGQGRARPAPRGAAGSRGPSPGGPSGT
jgi:hypothetical protein